LFFYELNFLLYRNTTIKKEHEKWIRNWPEGNIFINNEVFSLIQTSNKRQFIYDSSNKIVVVLRTTKPYYFYNGYILNDSIGYILNITSPNFKDKLLISPPLALFA